MDGRVGLQLDGSRRRIYGRYRQTAKAILGRRHQRRLVARVVATEAVSELATLLKLMFGVLQWKILFSQNLSMSPLCSRDWRACDGPIRLAVARG